jgi:uncharacterized protein YkwD
VLLALAFFVGLAVACTAGSVASASSLRLTSTEIAVVKLLNQTRVQHGLHTLQVRTSLCRAARADSREMVQREFFSHQSFNGESQTARVLRCGYTCKGCSSWRTGEVIAYGVGPAGMPQAIVDEWLQSAAHRTVLLDPRWRDVGVGRSRGTFRGLVGAAMFTVDLGRRTH